MPREQQRVPFLTEVSLEFASGRREARISDLGEGGCYVECVAAVRPGQLVPFEIQMSGGPNVRATGEVMYVFNGMGFGMRFIEVPEDLQVLIDNVVESSLVGAN